MSTDKKEFIDVAAAKQWVAVIKAALNRGKVVFDIDEIPELIGCLNAVGKYVEHIDKLQKVIDEIAKNPQLEMKVDILDVKRYREILAVLKASVNRSKAPLDLFEEVPVILQCFVNLTRLADHIDNLHHHLEIISKGSEPEKK